VDAVASERVCSEFVIALLTSAVEVIRVTSLLLTVVDLGHAACLVRSEFITCATNFAHGFVQGGGV